MYVAGLIRQHQPAVSTHPGAWYELFINSFVEPLHLVLGPVRVFVLLVFDVHVKMCTTLDEIKVIGQRIREIKNSKNSQFFTVCEMKIHISPLTVS